MSMCRVLCCWKRVFAMTSEFSWQNLLAFALLHLYPKVKCAHYSRYLLTPTFASQSPMIKRKSFVVLVLGPVGLPRTIQLQFLLH